MNSGKFEKTQNGYAGNIRTLALNAKVKIVPCEKKSQNAPHFRVETATAEIGAAWQKKTGEDRPYLSVVLDDLSFASPINAGLFEGDDGSFNLVWVRCKDA